VLDKAVDAAAAAATPAARRCSARVRGARPDDAPTGPAGANVRGAAAALDNASLPAASPYRFHRLAGRTLARRGKHNRTCSSLGRHDGTCNGAWS